MSFAVYDEVSNYDHYSPEWKLKIYLDGSKSIGIREEDFTEELKNLALKYEQDLIIFVESLDMDLCQRSLHIVQKRSADMELHVNENNEDFEKLKQVVYYTIFQTYLNERIRFLDDSTESTLI